MVRTPPENPNNGQPWPPVVEKQSHLSARTLGTGEAKTEIIVQTRLYRLITPLFGGGVEPGVNDPDNLIRATEIRGQLRFWWRAIRGGQFGGDLDRMKAREDEIWGAASNTKEHEENKERKQGQTEETVWKEVVQIVVENVKSGQEIFPYTISDIDGRIQFTHKLPAYVAFSLQPKRKTRESTANSNEIPLKSVRDNVSFTLKISFAKQWKQEVEAALWAWETFGGLGARTRRGGGAVELTEGVKSKYIENFPTGTDAAEIWIRSALKEMSAGERFPPNVPHLSSDMQLCVVGPTNSPASIWDMLIEKLQTFRQQRETYKDKRGKEKKSPNRWPEAEAIRKRVLKKVKGTNVDPPDKFPRAAFGLPIVFHFINEPGLKDVTLQGKSEKHDRLSSPLILRPLGCGEDKAFGLAAVLKGWDFPREGLQLIPKGGVPSSVEPSQIQLTPEEVRGLRLRYISGEKSLLQEFIDYLKSGEKE